MARPAGWRHRRQAEGRRRRQEPAPGPTTAAASPNSPPGRSPAAATPAAAPPPPLPLSGAVAAAALAAAAASPFLLSGALATALATVGGGDSLPGDIDHLRYFARALPQIPADALGRCPSIVDLLAVLANVGDRGLANLADVTLRLFPEIALPSQAFPIHQAQVGFEPTIFIKYF